MLVKHDNLCRGHTEKRVDLNQGKDDGVVEVNGLIYCWVAVGWLLGESHERRIVVSVGPRCK